MGSEMEVGDFYQIDEGDKIWILETPGVRGPMLFSFDKKTVFNFWTDYPDKLTPEQREIFRKENPMLAELKEGPLDKLEKI